MRKSSGDIVLILGIEGRAEMVHRDDMVLGGALSCGDAMLRHTLSCGRLTRGNPSRCGRALFHCGLRKTQQASHMGSEHEKDDRRHHRSGIPGRHCRHTDAGTGAAMYPIFLAFKKPDPNFKSVNPYARRLARRRRRQKRNRSRPARWRSAKIERQRTRIPELAVETCATPRGVLTDANPQQSLGGINAPHFFWHGSAGTAVPHCELFARDVTQIDSEGGRWPPGSARP